MLLSSLIRRSRDGAISSTEDVSLIPVKLSDTSMYERTELTLDY
jgi:hypothetical protein